MTDRPLDDPSARELLTADRPIPPGSTIGILGGGQLGRMLGFAARELGYRIAIFPATGFLATAQALARVYGVLKDKGSSDTLGAELYPFDKFCRLVGFEHVWEFDKRWPEA